MTEIAVVPDSLVDVRTGEVLEPTPANAATVIASLREFRKLVTEQIKNAELILLEETRRQGTKTLHLGDHTAEVRGGSELAWDLDTLGELRTIGLPEERWNALIRQTIEYKVDARVAAQLAAANDEYRRVIEAARRRIEKDPWVKVSA